MDSDSKGWYMVDNEPRWLHDDCAQYYGETRQIVNPNLVPKTKKADDLCQRCGDDYNTFMLLEHGNPAYW